METDDRNQPAPEDDSDVTILTIDDEDLLRESIVAYLEDSGFNVLEADNGRRGIEIFREKKPDMVLTDLRMPEMDGMEVVAIVTEESPETPVLVLSGMNAVSDAIGAIRAGAWDYVLKPIQDMSVFELTIRKSLERAKLMRENRRYKENLEEEIRKRTFELEQSLIKLRRALGATIDAMALTVETRDPYTAGHQRRVADLARAIAKEMNLTNDQIDGIRFAGVIHDLGKISVPAEILSKPARLSDIEFSLIKTHAQVGYDILKDIEFPWPVADIIVQHHEKIDGSGYPNGLKGDDILMEARILCVSDVVEAMASHRPYRPGLGIDRALEEITENKGLIYDAGVVDACVKVFRENKYDLEEKRLGG